MTTGVKPETAFQWEMHGMLCTTVSYANGRGYAMLETGGDTHYGVPVQASCVADLILVDCGASVAFVLLFWSPDR